MKVLGMARNQCGRCREYFNSNNAFELHRTGQHGIDRRCRTPAEMIDRGMSVNAAGFWISKAFDESRRSNIDGSQHESSS
jgi:hypothetical protein